MTRVGEYDIRVVATGQQIAETYSKAGVAVLVCIITLSLKTSVKSMERGSRLDGLIFARDMFSR